MSVNPREAQHPTQLLTFDNAEEKVLHPYVAELINNLRPERVLDFGCGNGLLSTFLDDRVEIDLYDPATTAEELLAPNVVRKNVRLLKQESDINSQFYDCVVQSSVAMCVPTREELERIFAKNSLAIKAGGHLVVVITHPCFLPYGFGHYYTSFTHDNFQYLAEARPYDVFMRVDGGDPVQFTDFHWTLSTILDIILTSNLRINRIIEHADIGYKKFTPNPHVTPWMFVVAEKEGG